MTEYLDNEGYPTEECLEIIRKWDVIEKGTEALVNFIEPLWYFGDWGFIRDGDKLELHTGGWSGNESIISALEDCHLFWVICWYSSQRGGHYEFDGITKIKPKTL